MQITRGKIQGAQKVCIYGPEGIGKSTLASKFPNALFIDTEGSTKHLDVARTPTPSSWNMLLSQVQYVKKNPDICDTLVIDTADWAETLCANAICAKHNKQGIEDFGYGKGYVYLEEEFGKMLNLLNDLVELNINIVLTAHAQMRKFEQPDEMGSYDRWELKLQKKTAPLVKEWADMLLFANYKTLVVNVDGQGVEKGKNKAQGGKRVVYTSHHPCWDAKNRHNLPAEIPMEYQAIAHCIITRPAMGSTMQPAVSAQIIPENDTIQIESNKTEQKSTENASVANNADEVVLSSPKHQESPVPDATNELEDHGVPKPLVDLMQANNVTLAELQNVVIARGYFPAGTPFENYPDDFVQGVLIAAWPQVLSVIEEQRIPF